MTDNAELAALDEMAVKPSALTDPVRVTYLGGPTYLIAAISLIR